MSINITKCTSTHNTTSCSRIPKYIVLHYTAGTKSKSGTAKNIANMFATTSTSASADFIVDDELIVQYNPDPKKYYCWAVGGVKYTSLTNSLAGKYYAIAKNSNCISIEMCSSKKNTSTLNATDNDWYITDSTVNNAIELTKYLMKLYNIDIDHVIMHNMVTGKLCPQPWCINEKALSNWNTFLAKLKEDDEMVTKIETKIFGQTCSIDGIYKDEKNYVGFDAFRKAGLTVSSNGKTPVIDTGNIKVNIDGKDTEVKGFNGNGTNYVSIREVAEALGKKVTWENNKIVIK